MAGTTQIGVMPSTSPPAIRLICSMCQSGSRIPSRVPLSRTTSQMMPRMRPCISLLKPAMTLLTMIIVITPSMTLTIDAMAMYRVRR